MFLCIVLLAIVSLIDCDAMVSCVPLENDAIIYCLLLLLLIKLDRLYLSQNNILGQLGSKYYISDKNINET